MREETQKKFNEATLLLSMGLPTTKRANEEYIKIESAFKSIVNDLEAEMEDLRQELASALQQIKP